MANCTPLSHSQASYGGSYELRSKNVNRLRSRSTLERERERVTIYKSSKKFRDQIFTENKLRWGAGASFLFFKEFRAIPLGNNNPKKENASMMKNLVGNMISTLMEVLMWITLVGNAIAGLWYGWETHGVTGAIGGLVLGAIAGMLTNILWWMFSTFQEIRDYLKKIAERE
jgi:hypothetical protein